MIESGDSSQTNKDINFVLPPLLVLCYLDNHCSCSLRMSDDDDFLMSEAVHVLEVCSDIVLGHFLKAVVEELEFIFRVVRVKVLVFSAVLVPSRVAQPHVEALVQKHEGWSFLPIIHYECVWRIHHSVLQEDWGQWCWSGRDYMEKS